MRQADDVEANAAYETEVLVRKLEGLLASRPVDGAGYVGRSRAREGGKGGVMAHTYITRTIDMASLTCGYNAATVRS